jgi:hypothetical protein
MTEEIPLQAKAAYFLEQFIKHTTPEARHKLLEEYDLLDSSPDIQPKGLKRNETTQISNEKEKIVLQEVQKRNLNVLSIDTIDDPDIKYVEEQIQLVVRYEGVKVKLNFVSERNDFHPEVAPVTDEWFRQSVETMMSHSLGESESANET